MRLFTERFVLANESFRLCGTSKFVSRSQEKIETFEDVHGAEDKIGLVMLIKKRTEIYCTPRCHFTMSWEVGLCQDYLVKYLIGSNKLTTYDYHVLQSFEVVQTFLHAIEIQEQSGPHFHLYGSFCRYRKTWLKRTITRMQMRINVADAVVKALFEVLVDLMKYLYSDVSRVSATALVTRFEFSKQQYFDGHHIGQPEAARGTGYTRVLGMIHGAVLGRLRQMKLVLRRYYRQGPRQELVILDILLKFISNLVFRAARCTHPDRWYHSIQHYRRRLGWKLKFIILEVEKAISVNWYYLN